MGEHLRATGLDRGLVGEIVVDQTARIQRDDGGVRLDALDLQRLRVRGLVGLVVAEAAVADEVDQHVAPEALAERHRQAHRAAARVDGVGVHVDDRDVEALGEIRRIACRARVVGIRREAHLVVGDDVQGAADAVSGERLEVERLRHDSLAREGCVAVDRDRDRAAGVGGRVGALLVGLQRAHAAGDDGVDELEVRRVRQEREVDAALLDAYLPGLADDHVDRARRARAVVVLHIAGAADGQALDHVVAGPALELGHDRRVVAPQNVREHIQAPAVRHAQDRLGDAGLCSQHDHLVQHEHHHVEPLDRELLLAEERAVQVVLERLDAQQPVEDVAPLVGRQRLGVGAGLDGLAQPEPLAVPREVLDLVRDRPGVRLAQARQRVGERLARDEQLECSGRNALQSVIAEAVVGGIERRIADRVAAQRVQARGHVAVCAIGVNERSGRPDLLWRGQAVSGVIGVEAGLTQSGRAVAAPSAASGRHGGDSKEDSAGAMAPIADETPVASGR